MADVAVIGGGIAGVSAAAFLAEGGLRVRLYEREAIAAGASGRNSGIVQHPFDPVLAGLYWSSLAEYRRLAGPVDGARGAGGGVTLANEPAGLLYVGRDVGLAARTAAQWAATWPDSRPEVLDGAVLRRLEPSLAPDLVACRLAIGFPVEPAAATEACAADARRRGVEIVVGGGEARPALVRGRAAGVARAGRVEPAGAVVVAAGPWSPGLVDPTGGWRPIQASWGVVASLALAGAPRHGLEAADIEIEPAGGGGRAGAAGPTGDGGPGPGAGSLDGRDGDIDFSLVPAVGSSALGSTFLSDEPDPETWLPALRRVGARYVPGVRDAPLLGLRCCARPVSRDGRPLIGAIPWVDGLWIVAGHGPWGISTGPGSARLLADRLLGRIADDALPAELRPGRFGQPMPPPASRRPPAYRQESGSNR